MTYVYKVTVKCASPRLADMVLAERLNHDEDYGFDYTISWDEA